MKSRTYFIVGLIAGAVSSASLLQQAAAAPAADTVADSAARAKPLGVGAVAPNVTLHLLDGRPVSLRAEMKRRPAVIVFYRGGWCPYCNLQLSGLKSIQHELDALGYQLIAIGMDRPEEMVNTREKHTLVYRLLSDNDAAAAKAFGVAFRVDDATLATYRGYNIDIEAASGRSHHILPVPSVFVVGADNTIRYVHSNPDYRVRLSAAAVLDAAKAALKPRRAEKPAAPKST